MNIKTVRYEGPFPIYRREPKHGRMVLLEIMPWVRIHRIWVGGRIGWHTTY